MSFNATVYERSEEPDFPDGCTEEVAAVWNLYARLWDENCAHDPIGATIMGDYRFNTEISSLTKEAQDVHLQAVRALRDEAAAIPVDKLPQDQVANYEYLLEMLNINIEFEELSPYEMPTQHMFGPHLVIVQLPNFHPWRTLEDCETFITRIRKFGTQADEMIEAFRAGIESKRTLPRGSVDSLIPQMESQVVDDAEQSPLFKLASANFEKAGGSLGDLKAAIDEVIVPAFRRLHEFLVNEYKDEARTDAGLWSIPGGEDMYRAAIRYYTSLNLDPSEVHELGKREVERITKKITDVRGQLGEEEGTLPEFARRMESRPENLPKDGDEIITKYKELLDVATTRTLELFYGLPEAKLEVKAVEEFRQVASPAAHYYPAPGDRSRPGVFYANTYKPETRPIFTMGAIALHEGIPGHHMQIAIAQELEQLPRLRKEVQGFTIGYVEGWGLYTEYLGEEMRFYEDPKDYYGRLVTELWRAARLVVDTGLHFEKWSRDEAIHYMCSQTCLGENEATVEVDRYTVMPGQALAYKIGEVKILELKDHAKATLGDKFSWKDFHRTVLDKGALPLKVLETSVNSWVDQVASQA